MSRVSLIVGLGNPGSEYEHTRHNAGFWFLDELARAHNLSFKTEKKFYGDTSRFKHAGEDVWLLKPQTFMNLSGQAVQAMAHFYKINLAQILVVHDELDLSVDTIRLKKGGGHGGHNGLRDISSRMGGNDFLRLRIGIGHPGEKSKVSNHVLKNASSDDKISIERNITRALNVLPLVIEGELQKAMNELHTEK